MQHLGHNKASTLAERCGHGRDSKLLIVHADDLGMTHSVNRASTRALETGLVNSGSIMVPCPWFPEIAAYARNHPGIDLGLHLTLTSEWNCYRWGSVSSRSRVSSLLDEHGYFYQTNSDVTARASLSEVETEIREQIERAHACGIQLTHLDSHMYTLYSSRGLLETLLKASREYKLPMLIARQWLAPGSLLASILTQDDIVIDRIVSARPGLPAEQWSEFYTHLIEKLEPGVTQLVVHLAHDDEEMGAATDYCDAWGSAWRQRDFDFFTSDTFRELLEENEIKMINYRELRELSLK